MNASLTRLPIGVSPPGLLDKPRWVIDSVGPRFAATDLKTAVQILRVQILCERPERKTAAWSVAAFEAEPEATHNPCAACQQTANAGHLRQRSERARVD